MDLSLVQVTDDVVRIFQADAEADEALAEFFRIEIDAFIVTGLRENQAFVMAEGDGKGDDFKAAQNRSTALSQQRCQKK